MHRVMFQTYERAWCCLLLASARSEGRSPRKPKRGCQGNEELREDVVMLYGAIPKAGFDL